VTSDGGSSVTFVSADRVWSCRADDGGAPVLLRLDRGGTRPVEPDTASADTGRMVAAHLPGTVFPGFTDHHVHLGLAEAPALRRNGLAEVHDLGWIPDEMAKWAACSRVPGSGLPDIRFAGAFLTAPGGYPAGRSWAPEGSWREVASASDASRAVAEQWTAGASFIKLVLNGEAGPVPHAQVVRAVVDSAHEAGLPVVAHAQGPGQARRAFEAGVDRLAHTPWTELL
jgi:imidazolonepropionase-like amidohydrolase